MNPDARSEPRGAPEGHEAVTPPGGTQKAKYVGPLNTVHRVRAEGARLYREWRRGELRTDELRAGIYALTALTSMLERSDFEARLVALETEHGLDHQEDAA